MQVFQREMGEGERGTLKSGVDVFMTTPLTKQKPFGNVLEALAV
jgi:hypothetical protein